MQIESFRVFRDLVESQSFSKAAQLNQITQSAVSQQIRAMEDKFSALLIERSSKRFALTREGECVYQASKEMLMHFETLRHQLDEMHNVISGNLRLSTVYSIGLHELPPYLKKFLRLYPQVNIHVEYRRSNEVYQEVLDGASDIGLVAFPIPKKGIKIDAFKRDKLLIICSPNHRLANKKEVDLEELDGCKFIAFEPDIPTRKAIDQIFSSARMEIRPIMEFDNIETVKRAVEIDAGISIVPQATVEQEVRAGTLMALDFKAQSHYRPLGIIYRTGRAQSPAMKRFLTTLQEPLG